MEIDRVRGLLEPGPLTNELLLVASELEEVKSALRCSGSFLGMSGELLQRYLVELAKKDNLLRQALSRPAPTRLKLRRGESREFKPLRPLAHLTTMSHDEPPAQRSAQLQENEELLAAEAGPCVVRAEEVAPCLDFCGRIDQLEPEQEPSGRQSGNAIASVSCTRTEAPATSENDESPPSAVADCFDETSLADVLRFLETKNARSQYVGLVALGRLTRDVAQLRPLCLACAAAAVHALSSFPIRRLQRAAIAVLAELVYVREIGCLIAQEILPALLLAMVANAADEKMQELACEVLARLAHGNEMLVVKAVVQVLLGHEDHCAVHIGCRALVRLRESDIIQSLHIADMLLPLTESQPHNLGLQQRASSMMQWLVRAGAVGLITERERPLLSTQWAHLLARFIDAEDAEARLANQFHADVQVLFQAEMVKHFEYEAAERSLHLRRSNVSKHRRVLDVVSCLVENLEDYKCRLEARALHYDPVEGLVQLDAQLRHRLFDEARDSLESSFISALMAASADAEASDSLADRTLRFRAECGALLDKKTEATQAYQEQLEEVRREVMLFEAVEYLELHAAEISATQISSALHMLEVAEPVAAPEAIERLRERLDRVSAGRLTVT